LSSLAKNKGMLETDNGRR